MQHVTISVAMCTYNGAAFLAEQLDSLARQTVLPAELVVCDDGSSDGTLDVLAAYAPRMPFLVRIYANASGYGVVRNFSQCIALCDSNYVALSDQDDIWEDDKLEQLMKKMAELELRHGKNESILVHSDLQVVNRQGELIHASFLKMQHLQVFEEKALPRLLAQNFVTGCTCLFNKALLQLVLPIPPHAAMHDWWIALVAAAAGRLGFVPASTIRYRQHGKNTVGAQGYFSLANVRKIISGTALAKQVGMAANQAVLLEQALRLRQIAVPAEVTKYNAALEVGGWNGLRGLLTGGMLKQGFGRNMVFALIIFLRLYVPAAKR